MPIPLGIHIGASIATAQWTAGDIVYRLSLAILILCPCTFVVAPPLDIYSECRVFQARSSRVCQPIANRYRRKKHAAICHNSIALANQTVGILQEEFQLLLIGASSNLLAPFSPSAHLQELAVVFVGLRRCMIQHPLHAWIKAAGIRKHITFHCFRHTFATLQIALGTDIYTVSKMLTHKRVKTTQIYADIVNSKKRESANRISLK